MSHPFVLRASCLGLGLWSALANAQSSLSPMPPSGPSDPTFDDGRSQGLAEGYNLGYDSGVADAIGSCQRDPGGCGITLGACLTAPQYGETEPNDNMVSADRLVLDTRFWGQSYGIDDEDWFYVVTDQPNQTLILNFSVPGGTVAGWKVSIRDAAGNVIAQFDTGSVSASISASGDITYRTTLGLVGTYYISLKPSTLNQDPYNLAAILQDSPLDTQNFIVGFFDTEVEPNNTPAEWNRLVTGVTMYGLINLSFQPGTEVRDPDGDGFEYSQGVDVDWYLYPTAGNEIITLSVCNREQCTQGNWLFEVYDETSAFMTSAGIYTPPLMAFNSDTGTPDMYVMGLNQGGNYYLRVSHKRLLTAPCTGYQIDLDNNGIPDGGQCGCDSGYQCDIDILNPGRPTTNPETGAPSYPLCLDGSGGGDAPQCTVGCRCVTYGGTIEVPANALTSQYNFTLTSTQQPPSTAGSDAYQDFISRPNPYAQ
ncbi:MAG: hypothetical protein VBE63_00095 [Lamprobacter sp.]|uniref:hypothetical protein n=1 Tax=Lamprobacter sp. TaxID=3100796 RepID=UPI002B259A6A|nr:hypothetical protein [Lamprobacter sp.]MEA3638326.1 hypothetical protein [Lamprobacter sp.]